MKKSVAFVLIFACLTFSACGGYDMEVYDFSDKNVTESFAENNKLAKWGEAATDELPKSHTVIINSREELEKSLSTELEVDFETESVVIFTYMATNVRDIKVDKVREKDGTLTVVLETKKPAPGVGDACMPYQRYVVIKLAKINAPKVEVLID